MIAAIPRLRASCSCSRTGLFLAVALCASPALGDDGRGTVRGLLPPPAGLASLSEPGAVAVPKRLYIANDDHTDYYWSAEAAAYRGAFLAMLDYYMAQAEATAGRPPDSRGRFNCDGSLWVREYEAARTPAQFQRLVGHLRAGNITMPLNTVVGLPGAMPAEAVLRDMYWAGRLERRENLRFSIVVPMENQTLPGGIASLWAGAGGRYSWKGICGCATRISAGDRPREVYRFTGPDGQSVLMKWNSVFGSLSLGSYAEARYPTNAVSIMDSNPSFQARWPWPVAGAFGYGWDDLQTTTTEFIDASENLSNASRRVIVSNEVDFFQDFEATHGAQITSYSGAFGNEWDLYTASMGAVTAAFKRSVEKLRTAEALATIATLYDGAFMNGREARRDSAFMACGLFYEHNWTSDGWVAKSVRAAWQRSIAAALTGYVDALHGDALQRLGSLVRDTVPAERHVVFNPLSWIRTDVADLQVTVPAPRRVVDVATGLEVRSQTVTVDGQPRVRIVAADVPSVGYRVYEVRPGAGATFPPAATVATPVLDHASYRVTLGARGQLASLLDHKDADRELVAGTGLFDLESGNGAVTVESTGPVSTTLRVQANGSPLHEARVTVHAGVDRLEVETRITQNFGSNEWYLSSFNLSGAIMRHEEVGMIARVGRLSGGGDYANENTRTDWLTLNHFVDLSQAGRGVTVSAADAPFFRAGNSTPTTLDTTTPTIATVVGMQVDGGSLGIQNQGGDALFVQRYALRTHGAYDPAAVMRFALEHQNPLVATRVTGGPTAPLPAEAWSLVALPGDVLLWALKPAEEAGQGIIARVWNVAEAPRSLSLGLPSFGIASATRTTHIETDLGPADVVAGQVSAGLARQQMATFRLFPGAVLLESPGVAPAPRGLDLSVFPNPGGPGAERTIAFSLARSGRVRVDVLDLRGARIASPVAGFFPAGRHAATWNGRDDHGREAPSGIYLVRIAAAGRADTRRLVVLR